MKFSVAGFIPALCGRSTSISEARVLIRRERVLFRQEDLVANEAMSAISYKYIGHLEEQLLQPTSQGTTIIGM